MSKGSHQGTPLRFRIDSAVQPTLCAFSRQVHFSYLMQSRNISRYLITVALLRPNSKQRWLQRRRPKCRRKNPSHWQYKKRQKVLKLKPREIKSEEEAPQ